MSNNDYLELAQRLECVLIEVEFTGELGEGCSHSIRYIISKLRGDITSPYLESLYNTGVH